MEAFLVQVIKKLTDLLIQEVKSRRGIHGSIRSLKEELEIIQPLLKDAEAKSENGETSEAVKAWVNQIRLQANRIENIVDEYRYHLTERHGKKGLAGCVGRVKSLKPRCKIESEIGSIKRSLCEIKGRVIGYGLRPFAPLNRVLDGEEHVDARLEALFVEEEDVVGIESVKNVIIGELVENRSEFLIISLVGQGGVGKTTLAKTVFDNGAVMRTFESARVWVTVSKPYNAKKILETLVEKLRVVQRGEGNTLNDLIELLRKHLQTKRYLIVFDDVWEESFWEEIKSALSTNNGSRILITTQNSSVADRCSNLHHNLTLQVEPWLETPAFELFCKKAFGTKFQGGCPNELWKASMDIVCKCEGLPLIISAIAGLLARKEKTVFEWERVLYDLNSKVGLSSELDRVNKILSLSYQDLPHWLRPCFTYICLFPKNHSIADETLYRLWISEGFVKAKRGKTLEEVAEGYMAELFRRNLVSLNRFKVAIGEGKFFLVHDLMRGVIISKAEELNFCQILDEKASKFRANSRRLMIFSNTVKTLERVEISGARTLFLSQTSNDQLTDSFMASLFRKLKLLEVLDLESSRIETLPKEVGKMLLLKYLSLRKTNIKSLPKSIGKLVGLQTLSAVEARPEGGADLIRDLEKLVKLKWLGVVGLTAELTSALCAVIGKLNHLQRLGIMSVNEVETLSLQHVSSPPLGLRDLMLIGRLEKLPGWISELQSLRAVALTSSRLNGEAIEALKGLPNLENLGLELEAYEGEELRFEDGGFRRLKSLMLIKLSNLRAVTIEEGALVVLERLEIYACPELENGLSVQHLKHLSYAIVNGNFII